jgi:DNA-binding protein H-NS
MATLEAIEMKIKRLHKQAEAIKAKQASAILDRIVELMQKSRVTIADIEVYIGKNKRGTMRSAAIATHATAAAKYVDPKTGATWSGHGRAPAWIANVRDRSRFLVDADASSASKDTASKGKKRGSYIRGPQPAKYRDPKTGATWSGRGPAPAWLGGAKDRTKFLIAGAADTALARGAGTVSKAKRAAKKASAGIGTVAHKGQPKGPQPAKYLDPKTGATWSGRGPAPAWLASAKDRSKFLIDATRAVAVNASSASKAKPAAKTVVAKKRAANKGASAKAAATERAAPKKVASKSAASIARKTGAKKVPATKANVAKGLVERAEVGAAPTPVTTEPTA